MNQKVSRNQRQTGLTPVRGQRRHPRECVWEQTKAIAAEAWLEFVKHSLIIIPLIPLACLMRLLELSHVRVETQRLLDFGEFLITLIQLWKTVEQLVPSSKLEANKMLIHRKTTSWKTNSNSSNAQEKVRLK